MQFSWNLWKWVQKNIRFYWQENGSAMVFFTHETQNHERAMPGTHPPLSVSNIERSEKCHFCRFDEETGRKISSCLTIVAGDHYRCTNVDAKEKSYSVCPSDFHLHSNYSHSTFDSDIALLKLSNDVEFEFSCGIKPICLPRVEPSPRYECHATGWGKTCMYKVGTILHCLITHKTKGCQQYPTGTIKTVPLGVLFWYHVAKRVVFSTQFLPMQKRCQCGSKIKKRHGFLTKVENSTIGVPKQ